jgi:hypothetical protein
MDVMTTVAVPFRLAVLGGLLGAWALYERVMMPSVRWAIRSRTNKALDEFGSRLQIAIRPFQRTRRQALIRRTACTARSRPNPRSCATMPTRSSTSRRA